MIYSLDAPSELLPFKGEINKAIKEDINRQSIKVTWIPPPPTSRPEDGLLL